MSFKTIAENPVDGFKINSNSQTFHDQRETGRFLPDCSNPVSKGYGVKKILHRTVCLASLLITREWKTENFQN